MLIAARIGLPTVEVNPEPTLISEHVRWSLCRTAGTILPAIAEVLASEAGHRSAGQP